MLMKDFGVTVQIDAPPDRVWGVMHDVERWHEWTPTMTSVRRTNEGPMRVGARARIHQPRLPPAEWTVTDWQEGTSFDWESRGPGVRVLAHHSVAANGGGTRATLSIQYSGMLGGLLGRLLTSINRRYLALEAEGLKRRSEALARV